MTIRELYEEAMKHNFEGLMLLIEWLVYEQGVDWDRDRKNIEYICEKYGDAINPHLIQYKKKLEL